MRRSVEELMSLKDRKVLLTGACGYIGRNLTDLFLEQGAEVVISDYDHIRLLRRAKELELPFGYSVAADLCRDEDLDNLVGIAANRMGTLNTFVHCAALTGTGVGVKQGWAAPFEYQETLPFRTSLDINLTAPFRIAQLLRDELRYVTGGVIVLFGSIYGSSAPQPSLYRGISGIGEAPVGYSAAKGGVEQLTRHLAAVLAPDIRVNCVVPGGLLRGQPTEFIARYQERVPLRRMGTEDDLRGAMVFLCSDMSEYVTGQVIHVDGGWGIW